MTEITHTYIHSLNFKNENIKTFILNFSSILNYPTTTIIDSLDRTIEIITLINKHKLNELDINDKIDFNKIKNSEINITYNELGIDTIGLYFSYFIHEKHKKEILIINVSNNIITDINYYHY